MRSLTQRSRPPTRRSNRAQIARVSHQVEKIVPFLVRKNRQLLSIPSHKETGLNIEKIFRLQLKSVTNVAVTFPVLAEAIKAELANPADVFDITVKEIRVYSNFSMSARFFYRTGTDGNRNLTISDYNNQAGIASIEVVYPVASRIAIASDVTNTATAVEIRNTETEAGSGSYVVVDVLARVSSRGTLLPPIPPTSLNFGSPSEPMQLD